MSHFPYEERAARAREASKAVMAAADRRRRLPSGRWDAEHPSFAEWEARVAEFWEAMRSALPPGFWQLAEQLKHGDPAGLDTIIDFLEADPVYLRSGYLKADLVRWLNRVRLSPEHVRRLRRVVLHVVSANWRREFNRYCLLARRLDGPGFRSDLQRLAKSPRADIRRRAERVLAVLDGKQVQWRGFVVRPLRGNFD